MEKNNEIFKKIRNNRVVLGIGMLAATATLLVGCGDSKSEKNTVPLARLDTSTLSTDDARQYIEVSKAVAQFREDQSDPSTRLINGVNDLYSRYKNPLQDQTFGSGWEQGLTGWVGVSSGDQEQATQVNATDAVEEVIRDRALEIAIVGDNPTDAAEIVNRYIDNVGNITKQEVLKEIAAITAEK
ncbi:MAG: hypothetical protein WCK26_03910 [Candidatus Saccharibacteria bacterium]